MSNTADELSPDLWRAIADGIDRSMPPREIVFGRVVKREELRKLIWLEEYGNLAIPLVAFAFGFAYYDTDATGAINRKADPTGTNEAYQTTLLVPRIGQTAIILDPGGQRRFPLCVGVIQSRGYWQGEG